MCFHSCFLISTLHTADTYFQIKKRLYVGSYFIIFYYFTFVSIHPSICPLITQKIVGGLYKNNGKH